MISCAGRSSVAGLRDGVATSNASTSDHGGPDRPRTCLSQSPAAVIRVLGCFRCFVAPQLLAATQSPYTCSVQQQQQTSSARFCSDTLAWDHLRAVCGLLRAARHRRNLWLPRHAPLLHGTGRHSAAMHGCAQCMCDMVHKAMRSLSIASMLCRGQDGDNCASRAAQCSEQAKDVRQHKWKARSTVLGRRAFPADSYILQQSVLCCYWNCLCCCQGRYSSSPWQQH